MTLRETPYGSYTLPQTVWVSPKAFWSRIDEDSGPGTLLIVLNKSWKRAADERHVVGDFALKLFNSVCMNALSSADWHGPLARTAYGAYWTRHIEAPIGRNDLDGFLPMHVSYPDGSFQIEHDWKVFSRAVGEPGQELYRRVQIEVQAIEERAPKAERTLPAFPWDWEDMMDIEG